jgi:hypothetical protein
LQIESKNEMLIKAWKCNSIWRDRKSRPKNNDFTSWSCLQMRNENCKNTRGLKRLSVIRFRRLHENGSER